MKFGSSIGVCQYELYIMFPIENIIYILKTHWEYLTQQAKEDDLGEQQLE